MPFRQADGTALGTRSARHERRLAFFVFAMRALRDLDIPVVDKVVLQVNADEEVGSDTSRPLTEEIAKQSRFVLVLEPGTGLEGTEDGAKRRRRLLGGGAREGGPCGRRLHAGASAIVELARQIERIAGFTKLERGITVNPGVISGGTRTNVIAAEARVDVDIRIARMKDADYLEKSFRKLKPVDKRCSIEVTGGLNRPPMERTPAIRGLFAHARRLAHHSGSIGGVIDGRRIGRQLHGGRGSSDLGWVGHCRRGRARGERKYSGGPYRRPDRLAGETRCGSAGAVAEAENRKRRASPRWRAGAARGDSTRT
jgi:glutamate carboxypeptidase